MKNNLSRKLLLTSLAIVFLSMVSGLVINLLTNDTSFTDWLKAKNIGTRELVFGVILTGIVILIAVYLQFRYTQQSDETADKKILTENIEPDIKRLFDSLKERYQNRYQSKLDGRFEITLEVSDDFDSQPRSITEQFGENATKGEAIEVIRQVFEQKGRLLIAGNPGVGKTVLLLKLAIDLLNKIEDPKKEPFPVIFNLASWSEKKEENFGDWLKAMLVSGYGFSRAFAETFLRQERIIFLLDGLDELARNEPPEIAAEKRAKCLASLNDYLSRGRKAVICSRISEFLAMKKQQKQDAPVSAKVRVLNLTPRQVLEAIKRAKDDENIKHHTAAKNLLGIFETGENENLLEALRTPFYFTTAMEIFDREIPNEKDLPQSIEEIKAHLIEHFVERKLKNEASPSFESEKTKKWLTWLARLMERKQLVAFELADLQPDDLARVWNYRLFYGLFVALVVGLFGGLVVGLFSSLFVGLVVGLFGGFRDSKISTEDIISIDSTKLLNWNIWKDILGVGLVIGLWFGLLGGLVGGLGVGLFNGLCFGLIGSSSVGFKRLKSIKGFAHLEHPYQRIFGGLVVNLIFSIFTWLVLLAASVFAVINFELVPLMIYVSSVLIWFFFIDLFDTPLFRHCCLRFALYLEGVMPLKYAMFLDYAAEARILEEDGGQWRFRHQNLQEYFANQIDR